MKENNGGLMKGRRVQVKFNTGTRFHKSKRDLLNKRHKQELKQLNKAYK